MARAGLLATGTSEYDPPMPIDLGSLAILHYPAAPLLAKADPVSAMTPEVREVAARMVTLMRKADGIGLAAPQVGLPWRLFVAHVPPGEGRSPETDPPTATAGPVVYVNPVLSDPRGELESSEEGCLSLPEIRGNVLRSPAISITADDLQGRSFTAHGAGLLARCWQHEVDHLDGVLIIHRMNQLSRLKNRSKVRGLERAARAL